jgi:hypothetical protein
MPNKQFLEDYSLFRKFKMDVPETMDHLKKPAINMICKKCNSNETFNMINQYHELYSYNNVSTANKNLRLIYLCESCKLYSREFCVYVSPERDHLYKYGQYPEWEIKIDKALEKTLHKHSKTFRKGLVCESQGYGIGAFAYYRRITEDIIDELLESITELIDAEHKAEYMEALEKTKTTRVTQEKINLVKDLLPSILKPNGINTLGVLHSELSEGLHAESDEACLENANQIKIILVFLLSQIVRSKESAKEFSESMKSLLTKKMNK